MSNKKKIILIISVVFLIVLTNIITITLYKSNENIVLSDSTNNKNKINNSFLTYMIETESGSGIYEKTTSNEWPASGYIFNSTLSGCENGGELKWDDENKQVLMLSVKSDKCYVYFNKYLSPTVSSVSVTNTTASSISVSVSASGGTNNIVTYYYSINDGAYTSSSSNTHTFSGLNKGTTYSIKVYVKDSNGVDSAVKIISAETESAVLLADYIKGLYTSQGSNGIYYHTSSLANSAGDNSYRYTGANPNNYVCFGSDAATCPNDNLYRIIGVFGSEVKLIKATRYGNYAWNSSGGNTWSASSIKSTLNTTYLNSLSSTWQNKIATHTWKVGGMEYNNSYTAKQYYDIEVGSSSSSTTDSMKIGLMYLSDYGYAPINNYWTKSLYDYFGVAIDNWLYLGDCQWTISRYKSNSFSAFYIDAYGGVYDTEYLVTNLYMVRPSFYLKSSTTYLSGIGTSANPIRIN